MNNKEKIIIAKLFNIVANQQKVITKLAAQLIADPNLEYLKTAVDAAIVNAGVRTPYSAFVSTKPGGKQDGITIENAYIVTVSGLAGADNTLKQKFLTTYLKQIHTQKPELAGKVNVVFA